MSSNISRDSNKYIIKKNVPLTSTPSISNNSNALTDPDNVNLSSLSLNGITVTASAANLNTLNSTPGTASANTALITNSSRNINNINSISCSSLSINGTNITGITTSSGKSNSSYLNNVAIGIANSKKAMILDSNKNISNINNMSASALSLNNVKLSTTNTKRNVISNYLKQFTDIQYNTSTNGTQNSVCWSQTLKLFVSVGYLIYTSADGITWTLRTAPNSCTWLSVCWSTELSLFVATGYYNSTSTDSIMSSPDGINWTVRTAPSVKQWNSICWSPKLNLFVAVAKSGASSNIITSSDGINWISRTNPQATLGLSSICWSPQLSLFVAVGIVNSIGMMLYSSNGIDWTATGASANFWTSICWSSELSLFVVVGYTTTAIPNSASQLNYAVSTSTNGINWTITSMNQTTFAPLYPKVYWNSQLLKFIIIFSQTIGPSEPSSFISISTDGVNWTITSVTNANGSTLTNINIRSKIAINSLCHASEINTIVGVGSVLYGNYPYSIVSGFAYNTISTNIIYKPNVISKLMSNLELTNTTNISTISGNNWNCVCWSPELGIFCAVSTNGTNRVATSTDAKTWIPQTAAAASSWISICWASSLNLFVAVAQTASASNSIMTSPDGINWTLRTSPNTNSWTFVCWSPDLGMFVAIAQNASVSSTIITSTNGIDWTARTAPYSTTWQHMVWCSELKLFVAISQASYSMSSSNGIDWTGASVPLANARNIKWSPQLGMFIAVTSSNSTYMISYDGINWTTNPWPSNLGLNMYGLLWCDKLGIFVCSGDYNSTTYMLYSHDGFIWNYVLIPNQTNYSYFNIKYGCWSSDLGIFVILPMGQNTFIRSISIDNLSSLNLNNINSMSNTILSNSSYNKNLTKYWYSKTSTADNNWTSLTFSEELCMIVAIASTGTTSDNIMSSIDGNNWIVQTSPSTNAWASICWSPELSLFVAVASSGTGDRVMTSSDGINWTSRASAVDNNWTSVCWSNKLQLFVAVASSGSGNRVMTSSDGNTWIARTSAANNDWTSICWSPELSLFVAVASSGSGNRIMTSTNGILWTIQTSPTDNNWSSVCWSMSLGLFVAVASNGTIDDQIMTSTNGINWSSQTSPAANSWNSVCWSFDLKIFIAVASSGTGNRIMSSNDGRNWFVQTSSADNNWNCVHWCNSLSIFASVAGSGTGNRLMISNINLPTYKNALVPNSINQMTSFNTVYGQTYTINGSQSAYRLGIYTKASDNWGCMRLTYNSSSTNYVDYSTSSAGNRLNINVNGGNQIFNIVNHNGSNTGLQINNILVTASANDLNKLNAAFGTAVPSKILALDSNRNISGINTLSVNTVLLNNKIILSNNDNNNSYLTNATAGTASALTTLVTNSSTNLGGINTLGTNTLTITNSNIYTNNKITVPKALAAFKKYGNFPSNISASSIAWAPSLGLFVAVGTNWNNDKYAVNNINYSYDGINWITAKTHINNTYTSVCWSPELKLFVVVSNTGTTFSNNRVLTSNNGINWNMQYCPPYSWNSVCWSPTLSLFVAVNNDGSTTNSIMTSPNGVNWTARTSPNANPITSICWADTLGLFVTVASSGTNQVMTSSDGITWTARTEAVNSAWKSVCWSSELGLLIAVSSAGSSTSTSIMSSSNGINWTVRTAPSVNQWQSVCWTGGSMALFVAVSNNNNGNRIMKSSDGINWSSINTTNKDFSYTTVAYSPDLNILITALNDSNNYNKFMSSNDGINLNYINTSFDLNYTKVIYADSLNLYVAIGSIGRNNIAISSDCKQWSLQIPANLNNGFTDIAWSSTLGILVAISANYINYSYNGINWTSINTPNTNQWSSVCWSSSLNLFIAVANINYTTNNFMKSSNGTTWTLFSYSSSTNICDICWSPTLSLFAAISYNSQVITSSDGSNWNVTTLSPASSYQYIQWISGMNVFFTTDNYYYSLSSDGVNWTRYQFICNVNGSNNVFVSVVRVDYIPSLKILLATGYYNLTGTYSLFYSFDGKAWISNANANYNTYNSITYFPNSNIVLQYSNNSSNTPYCPFLILDLNYYNNILFNNYNIGNLSNQVLSKSVISNTPTFSLKNGFQSYNYYCSYWSSELSLYVAISSTSDTVNTSKVYYSSDGINWKYTTYSFQSNKQVFWNSICSIPGTLVAVGTSSTETNKVMTSSDGINWYGSTVFPAGINLFSVCYSPELNLIVAAAGGYMYSSLNAYNWTQTFNSSTYNIGTIVCWCKNLNKFVSIGYNATGISSDGINWTANSYLIGGGWSSICYNPSNNIIVGVSTNSKILTSSNGIDWNLQTLSSGSIAIQWTKVCYSTELNLFVAGSSNNYAYSSDGINWTLVNFNYGNFELICWCPEIGLFVTPQAISNTLILNSKTAIGCNEGVMYIDQNTGNLGLGGNTTPSYKLHLSSDSAAKPSTSTWTVSSDERLKENIQDADLNLCYNNIKNLRLTKYKWKDDVYTSDEVTDRSKLGWIAQEVETIFPKAVEKHNLHGYEDCRTLNTDQIIASMYGCLKKIINIYDEQTNELLKLEIDINKIQNTIEELTK